MADRDEDEDEDEERRKTSGAAGFRGRGLAGDQWRSETRVARWGRVRPEGGDSRLGCFARGSTIHMSSPGAGRQCFLSGGWRERRVARIGWRTRLARPSVGAVPCDGAAFTHKNATRI